MNEGCVGQVTDVSSQEPSSSLQGHKDEIVEEQAGDGLALSEREVEATNKSKILQQSEKRS